MRPNSSLAEPRLTELDAPVLATRDTVRFEHGLPGFEACRGFVLMASEALGPVQCLKSADGPPVSFLVIDPRRVLPEFRCQLSEGDRLRLGVGAADDDSLLWLSLITIELDGTVTVNLRAPVVINPTRMVGHQVVPHECVYPLRYVVSEGQ